MSGKILRFIGCLTLFILLTKHPYLKMLLEVPLYWEKINIEDSEDWLKEVILNPEQELEVTPIKWITEQVGLERAEILILSKTSKVELEKIYLLRINPKYFKFSTHVNSREALNAEDWANKLDATVVINGSYYDRFFMPDTPIVSNKIRLGPKDYTAKHGALLVSSSGTKVIEFDQQNNLDTALEIADELMVSYPILVGSSETCCLESHEDWLANRSFIGEDQTGLIILGVTKNAFFSLKRFGKFLKNSELNLETALNLDGGPISALTIRTKEKLISYAGSWTINAEPGNEKRIKAIVSGKPKLPIIIAVKKR